MFWTKRYIGESNADQLLSTIAFGVDGMLAVSWHMLSPLLKWIVIFPLLGTIFFLRIFKDVFLVEKLFPALLLFLGLGLVGDKYDAVGLIKHLFLPKISGEDLFAKHYKNPADEQFEVSKNPKNLIFIYVESLEDTYQNPQLFGHNLLNELSSITIPHISFPKFIQTKGADWTIGGVVASQCGIPLKLLTIFDSNHFGENVRHFLVGAICLSDVLKAKGYYNVFLKGSSLHFAGFNLFLNAHHYDESYGKEEWLKEGFTEQDMIGWGLPDDLLFQQAKLKLNQLMNKKQPFNLTLLTVDLHGLEGQLNKTCYAQGARTFSDVVECTSHEIVDFIKYVENQGWVDKVVIVVIGDHLAMENAVSDKLNSSSSRYVFNLILSHPRLQKVRETILHVDLYPTVLHALGIRWSGNKLAMGYSAFSSDDESTYLRHKLIDKIVASQSPYYRRLWTHS